MGTLQSHKKIAVPRFDERHGLFTIGHSNHELEKFIELLKASKIEVLVDIRSNPYSRYASQFNKDNLTKAIQVRGMKYLFLGKELGGRPKDREFYDSEGHILYSHLSESPLFLEGIERLIHGMKTDRIALMCSEENPAKCHRLLLVSKVLEDRGITVFHIRGDGRIQSNEDISRENEKPKTNEAQQNLFRKTEGSPEYFIGIQDPLQSPGSSTGPG